MYLRTAKLTDNLKVIMYMCTLSCSFAKMIIVADGRRYVRKVRGLRDVMLKCIL